MVKRLLMVLVLAFVLAVPTAFAAPRSAPAALPAPPGLVAKLKLQALHPTKFELKLVAKCLTAYGTTTSGAILPKPPVCTKLRMALQLRVKAYVAKLHVRPSTGADSGNG